jgi:beta-lactamase superfamily II metal-dependent hydrolase
MADMVAVDDTDDVTWEFGTIQILFLSMGQGDCCVITCPDGQHVMIDCGSKALEAADAMVDIQAVLRSVTNHEDSDYGWISALILTHPDRDHITKVAEIIGGEAYDVGGDTRTFDPISVSKVYFSDFNTGRTDFTSSPLRYYGASMCATTLYYYSKVSEMYCVTLRTKERVLHKWVEPFDKSGYTNVPIAGDRVTVKSGVLESNPTVTWEVSIIAGNVAREPGDQSDTDGRNAASLVTLVRLGTETALICGDATISTENYLYNTFSTKPDIKSVALLQAPHHGSSVTSSSAKFVNLVKPKRVAISVQKDEHSHHLPGRAAVDAYVKNAVATKTPRPTTAWRSLDDDAFHDIKTAWTFHGNYREEVNNQFAPVRYVRTDANDDFTGEVILDGFTRPTKYVLYQNPLSKDVKQTGLDQHLFYYFP